MRFKKYLLSEEISMYPTPSEMASYALKKEKGGHNKAIEFLLHKKYNAAEKDKKIILDAIEILKKQRISK